MKILILFTIAVFTSFQNDCRLLENGKYKIVYDEEFKENQFARIEVKDEKLIWVAGKIICNFKIEKLSDCSFRLESLDPPSHDTIMKIGNPYFEITKTKGRVSHFTHRRDANVILDSGKFVRIQ